MSASCKREATPELDVLRSRIADLEKTLAQAQKFKAWAMDQLSRAGIAFVQPGTGQSGQAKSEDYTNDEIAFDANSCVCPFCGQIDKRVEDSCDLQKCSVMTCGHQMRANRWSLPHLKDI
jgi:hypothetical protein